MQADEVLTQWLAEEAAVRERVGNNYGVAKPSDIAGLSGLQAMQMMIEGKLPAPWIAQTLDFSLVKVEPGIAVFQGRPHASYYNPMGTIHGGWYATLLDSALGCCVHTTLAPGKAYTTLEIKVNMVRALTESVPLVRAEGRVIHVGGQVATSEAKLVGPDGKLYAHATTTCLILTPPGDKK